LLRVFDNFVHHLRQCVANEGHLQGVIYQK
jgi:hypothetical protein